MPRTLSPGLARTFAALGLVFCVAMLSLPAAAAPTFTIIHAFNGTTDGASPQGGLLQDIGGNIHGETQLGGLNGVGTNYVVSSNGATFKTLYNFLPPANPNDGQAPIGGLRNLVGDAQVTGIDFGVTNAGGIDNLGTVFVSDQLGNELVIHNFTGIGNDGAVPVGRLLPWVDGFYYGTTLDGGKYGQGEVFRIAGNGAFKVLHSFDLSDGANPQGGLQYGNDGNFYGTTVGGGKDNEGVVYRISPAGSFKIIYQFTGAGDGGAPYGELATDFKGNLYGTTSGGGSGTVGTIFRVSQLGSFSLLYTFPTASDGSNPMGGVPFGSLTIGSSDCSPDLFVGPTRARAALYQRATGHVMGGSSAITLFGTTTLGGNATNSGVVFALNTGSHAYNVIYAFSGTDGSTPDGKLLGSFDGNIYGTTTSGGPMGAGEVFKIGGVLAASTVHSTFQGFHSIR